MFHTVSSATIVLNYCKLLIYFLPHVTGSRKVFKLVIRAPEDINLKRDLTVEVIEIDQTIATSVIMNMKGENCFDVEFMKSMSLLQSS